MKKLNRGIEPEVLKSFTNANNWKDCRHVHKASIWEALESMQGSFCAYCECKPSQKHIEHFRCKHNFPALTFNWSNLFGSCDYDTRCGRYKDNRARPYDPDTLIKPDEDDPSEYLVFLITGRIRAADSLDPLKQKKANETIRVFNLNGDSALVSSRKAALQAQLRLIQEVYSMLGDFSDEDFKQLIEEEIALLQEYEFRTALTHAWRYNSTY